MKVIRIYNRIRRDCRINLECENCEYVQEDKNAYDDRNFWDNVVPNLKCSKCGKSSNDFGLDILHIATAYKEHEII